MTRIILNLSALAFATASHADGVYTMPVQSVEPVDHQLGAPVFERADNWGTDGYCVEGLNSGDVEYVKANRMDSEVPQVLSVKLVRATQPTWLDNLFSRTMDEVKFDTKKVEKYGSCYKYSPKSHTPAS